MAMRGVEERPAGLTYRDGLVSAAEEAALLSDLRALETEPVRMHGVESRRQVCHFGVGYDYNSRASASAAPLPGYLVRLRERAAGIVAADPDGLVEALITRYPPGAGIGWHRDAPMFGSLVLGVSLGSDSVMRFQRRAAGGERRVYEQPLARRSAYALTGAARWSWQHSVPAGEQERWSVTFRELRSG